MHFYTPQQVEYIREHAKGRSNAELTELVNAYFELDLTVGQIRSCKKNRKINSGLNGQFKPGNIPFNKGRKGVGGWEPTQFKKGHRPLNYKPVGTERVNSYGYIDVKVADPNKWKGKHILIWEEHSGKSVPKGHVVIFGDGNKLNLDIDNLILVSRKQLVALNKKGLIQDDAGLTKTAIILVDVYGKISERKKKG